MIKKKLMYGKLVNNFNRKYPLNINIKKSLNFLNEVHLDIGFSYEISEYSKYSTIPK